MKKLLLLLFAVIASLSCCFAQTETKAFELVFKTSDYTTNVGGYTATWTHTYDSRIYKIVNFNNNNNGGWNFIKAGSKSNASIASIATTFKVEEAISSLVVTYGQAKNTSALKLFIADNADFTNATVLTLATPSNSSTTTTITETYTIADPTPDRYYKLQYEQAKGANGDLVFHGVVFNATTSTSTKTDPEISFPKAEYSAVKGESFESPVLNNPNNVAVTYASEDEEVATVSATGTVTLIGQGTTTISAKSEATDDYFSKTVSYTLTVTDPNAPLAWTHNFDVAYSGITKFTSGVDSVFTLTKKDWTIRFEGESATATGKDTSGRGLGFGNSTHPITSIDFSTKAFNTCEITKIEAEVAWNVAAKYTVSVSGTTVGEGSFETSSTNTTTITASLGATPLRGKSISLHIERTGTTAKQFYIKTLKVYYRNLTDIPADLTFAQEKYTAKVDNLLEVEVINPNGLDVEFSMPEADEDVYILEQEANTATMDFDKWGVYTLKATSAAQGNFAAGEALTTIVVFPDTRLDLSEDVELTDDGLTIPAEGTTLFFGEPEEGIEIYHRFQPAEQPEAAPYRETARDTHTLYYHSQGIAIDTAGTLTYFTSHSGHDSDLTSIPVALREPTTGIEAIGTDTAATAEEMFDLQGRRVMSAPRQGIYIVRKGTDVKKVIVK